MTSFSDLGLAEPILRALAAQNYETPTPIQAAVIPTLLSGRDVIGIAQTGTGKTASFVLPILDDLARNGAHPKARTCSALILTPTRELAQQIAENIELYAANIKASVTVVVGGVKPAPQVRALARGTDILVATPGRLLDHMNEGVVSLGQTTRIILDEADQMLDLGFMPAIRKIMGRLPKARQTVLMSATMPTQIRALAKDFLTNPAEIAVAAVSRPIERIAARVRHTPTSAKRDVLTEILKNEEGSVRAIVFTRTKRGADKVSKHLEGAGLTAAAIHGNKSQNQRERALGAFRTGEIAILVATDIAARGIDIDDVSHVINFELPNVPEAYVHRIGRTARAGREGIAISLCDGEEAPLLRDIEKLIGHSISVDPLSVAVSSEAATRSTGARPAQRTRSQGPRQGQHQGPRQAQGRKAPGQRAQDQHTTRSPNGKDQPEASPARVKPASPTPASGERAIKGRVDQRPRRPEGGRDEMKAGLERMLGRSNPRSRSRGEVA